MNESKNAKTGARQCDKAKRFHQVGLLSRKGLEVVLR